MAEPHIVGGDPVNPNAATGQRNFIQEMGFKQAFVTKDIVEMKDFPKVMPFPSRASTTQYTELSGGDETTDFIKKLLFIFKEEMNAVRQELGPKGEHAFQDFEKIAIVNQRAPARVKTSPAWSNFALEELQDRSLLREKLMAMAMTHFTSTAKGRTHATIRLNPEKFNVAAPGGWGSGPAYHLGVASLYAKMDSKPDAVPFVPATPDNLVYSASIYKEAEKHAAAGDAERAAYFTASANQQRAEEEVSPEENYRPGAKGMGLVLESFFSRLDGPEKIKDARKKWVHFVLQNFENLELNRAFVHTGDYNKDPNIEPSLTLLLDAFEATLTPKEKELFAQERTRHQLTAKEVDAFEASWQSPRLKPDQTWSYLPLLKSVGEAPFASGKGVPPFGHGKHLVSKVDAEEVLRGTVLANTFTVTRDLLTYFGKFDDKVADYVTTLGPKDHWIDMGSGEGIAIEDYVGSRKLQNVNSDYEKDLRKRRPIIMNALDKILAQKPGEKAYVTGITKEMDRKDVPTYDDRLRNLTGDWLENVPDAKITGEPRGKAKVITDMYGVFPYAPQADETLKKYLRVLRPDGAIFIYFPSGGMTKSSVAVDGRPVPMLEWMMGLEKVGLKITSLNAGGGRSGTLQIEFAPGATAESVSARIPKLKLLLADGEQPPLRRYEQVP